MPMIPMPVRASLTSSSLNGLMIASTFFIHHPPEARPGEQRSCRPSLKEITSFRDNSSPDLPLSWAAAIGMHAFQALTDRSRGLVEGSDGGPVGVPPDCTLAKVTAPPGRGAWGYGGHFEAPMWSRPALRDVVLAHLRIECRAAQAEQGGGRLLVPAGGVQRLEDRGALDLLQRARRHFRRCDGAAERPSPPPCWSDSGRSPSVSSRPRATSTARSSACCSSRTLPGHA